MLFCRCGKYLGPTSGFCESCGAKRELAEHFTPPGEVLWKIQLPAAVLGRPQVTSNGLLVTWGERGTMGGFSLLNLRSGEIIWETRSNEAFEGGAVVLDGQIIYGTRGLFRGDPGKVISLALEDGSLNWQSQLKGSNWTHTIFSEGQVFCSCDQGFVYCLDSRDGQHTNKWPILFKPGLIDLYIHGKNLFIIHRDGIYWKLQLPHTYKPHQGSTIGDNIKLKGRGLFLERLLWQGTASGQLLQIDLHKNEVFQVATNFKRLYGTPVCKDNLVYLAGGDHSVRAFEKKSGREMWRYDLEHSVSNTCAIAGEALVAGSVDGKLTAVDRNTGQFLWQYSAGKDRFGNPNSYLTDLTGDEYTIYAGDRSGALVAIPWHYGNYAEVARIMEERGKRNQAADFYVMSAYYETQDYQKMQKSQNRAVQLWLEDGQLIHAAEYMRYQPNTDYGKVAQYYEHAAEVHRNHEPQKAAQYWIQAVGYYEEIGERSKARLCLQNARKVCQLPYLDLDLINLPPEWEVEDEQTITMRIRNKGNAPAENIRVLFGGILKNAVEWVCDCILQPGGTINGNIPLTAISTGKLQIEINYLSEEGLNFSSPSDYAITVLRDRNVVMVDGDAGLLKMDQLGGRFKIHVKGDTGFIKTTEKNNIEDINMNNSETQ